MSALAKAELQRYEAALQRMYRDQSNAVSLRFERSLRTKGKDHSQIHIVPVQLGRLSDAVPIFMQSAAEYGLKVSEIGDSDGAVEDVVVSMEGGPYQEYFYVELPVGGADGIDHVRLV
jgi:hypothetical protein